MRKLLLTACALAGIAGSAHAGNIAAFSQTSAGNTVHATVNGTDTVTTLAITNASISIGQFAVGIPPASDLTLLATSTDAAVPVGSAVIQHYSGSFCITTGPGCSGVNVLSGTFTDAAFGAVGGPGLAVNVNNPPDTLNLTSSIIPASDLDAPNALSLGFTNLSPKLALVGSTLAPFSASFAGTVSGSRAPVPEPAAIAVFGMGLTGLLFARKRKLV